jgi:hypothetical protein
MGVCVEGCFGAAVAMLFAVVMVNVQAGMVAEQLG